MSELTGRIAEVLRQHPEWFNPTRSRWRWEFDELTAHVAERVAELFTEVELSHFDGSSTIQWIFQRGTESAPPVPASPNPPDSGNPVHSPHSGQEPTPQHDSEAEK